VWHIHPNLLLGQPTGESFSKEDVGEFGAAVAGGRVGGGTVVECFKVDAVFWSVFVADGGKHDDSRGLGGDDPVEEAHREDEVSMLSYFEEEKDE